MGSEMCIRDRQEEARARWITFSRRQGSDVGSTSRRNCRTLSGVCRAENGGYTSDEQSATSISSRAARDNGKNTKALQSLSFSDLSLGRHFMKSSGNFSMLEPLRLRLRKLLPTHFPEEQNGLAAKEENKHTPNMLRACRRLTK